MHGDNDALDARLVELETRMAFLEATLGEMSDALAAARIENERSADLFRRVIAELKQRSPQMADPADEPPPPHY
jgi:SlyX protein